MPGLNVDLLSGGCYITSSNEKGFVAFQSSILLYISHFYVSLITEETIGLKHLSVKLRINKKMSNNLSYDRKLVYFRISDRRT